MLVVFILRFARESANEIEDIVGLTMQEWTMLDGDFDPLEAATMGASQEYAIKTLLGSRGHVA